MPWHESHTFTLTFVTPAFLHGSSSTGTAEFRLPSLKGMLRFWTRAILWNDCAQSESPITMMADVETRLYGKTEMASSIRFRLENVKSPRYPNIFFDKNHPTRETEADHPEIRVHHGLAYLAGPGVHHYRNCWTTSYLENGFQATIRLSCMYMSRFDMTILKKACIAFTLFGGLGQRSRRGFGSFTLTCEDGWLEIPDTPEEILRFFRSLAGPPQDISHASEHDLPPYTAFSPFARCALVQSSTPLENRDPVRLLERFGRAFLRYRSNGRFGKLPWKKERSLQKFLHDKNKMLAFINAKKVSAPSRAIFGLPHNYYFQKRNVRVFVNAVKRDPHTKRKTETRRASPFFISVVRLRNSTYALVLTFLPAHFFPDDVHLQLSSPHPPEEVPFHPQWDIIHEFFEFLPNRMNQLKVLLDSKEVS